MNQGTIAIIVLVGFFLLLFVLLRLIGGFAPGWIVRCTKCGKIRKADDAGIVRVGSIASFSYTVDWCSKCRKILFHVVERESVKDQNKGRNDISR